MSNKSIKVRSQNPHQSQEYYLPLNDATLESLPGGISPHLSGHTSNYFVAEPDWLRNALEDNPANLMELNYLSKRLDGFDRNELATYLAVRETKKQSSVADLINLTFHSNKYTLITDVSDPVMIGVKYHLAEHGSIPITDIDSKNTELYNKGLALLQSKTYEPTPMGLLFPPVAPLPLEPLYQTGGIFPLYDYSGNSTLMAEITTQQRMDMETAPVWLHLPLEPFENSDLFLRMGVKEEDVLILSADDTLFPMVCWNEYSFASVNEFAGALQEVPPEKQSALLALAEEMGNSDNLDILTDYALASGNLIHLPTVGTIEEYGRWLLEESGQFSSYKALAYEGLDDYIDYEMLGESYADRQSGLFTPSGYFGVDDPNFAYILEPEQDVMELEDSFPELQL